MGLTQARPNYTENVTDLYVHVQTVDIRRSSPIFQAPGYEANIPCEVKQGQVVLGSLTPHVGHPACSQPVVNTTTICRHGTHPGLPGGVPQIPYSLHMLTTLGRDLLGHARVGQLGALLSCTTSCSLK